MKNYGFSIFTWYLPLRYFTQLEEADAEGVEETSDPQLEQR